MAHRPPEQSYRAVDYRCNRNLLEAATKASVRRFVYVSVFGAPLFKGLDYVNAHEDFVGELDSSRLDSAIVRPTAFFSSMAPILEMAKRGTVYLVGDGTHRINPISELDLAWICGDAIQGGDREVSVGGPGTYTRRQIGELAFEALGREPRFVSIPRSIFEIMTQAIRPFSPRIAALGLFGSRAMQLDVVAQAVGPTT